MYPKKLEDAPALCQSGGKPCGKMDGTKSPTALDKYIKFCVIEIKR
jgi:hypothetical protein